MSTGSESLARLVIERALELGFDRVGIVPAETPAHYEAYQRWLEAERHGEMTYMARNADLRSHPAHLHPGTRSVVAVAMSHRPGDDDGRAGGIARYARGDDYHKLMRKRLAKLSRFVTELTGGPDDARPPGRACVDSAPVLERDIAARAGLGWLAKSANVISQDLGSYLFLGELLVTTELPEVSASAPDRCGRCTDCIDACPTDAIVAPYVVDGRRCISYLTIELHGPIPRALRSAIGDHVFGCDICQIVCPWNRKAPPLREAAFRPRHELVGLSAADLLRISDDEFLRRTVASPLRRTGRARLARNAAVVVGNSGDRAALPVLVEALREDEAPLVRGHAAWAIGRLGGPVARALLEMARLREADPYVREEVDAALATAA